jgi:ligand-binding SRPBCC domain-containing protein
VVVNVCPAATSTAPPDRFWEILMRPEAYEEWTDATFLSAEPPGPVRPGTAIHMKAPGFGRDWPVRLDVTDLDSNRRWIDVVAHLPFGVDNHEHLTLTETPDGGTLIRFN